MKTTKTGDQFKGYQPYLGYIGNQAQKVPNYLVSSKANHPGSKHLGGMVELLFSRKVEDQLKRSKALTKFIRSREMTFSKTDKKGEQKIFAVPCTSTPVCITKSVFNSLNESSEVLVAALRLVLQDIYGSRSVKESAFVRSLPPDEQNTFIRTVEKCPNYIPQLHDPVMKDYPFFDVVGLDLVLAEDYCDPSVADHLPFRLLEINAGSPSGASNNVQLLEGLKVVDPEVLKTIGRVMPNDHFSILSDTYRSLGQAWTGRSDSVQIILPPGGASGAAPEIHQLALGSGLIYADAGQLYRDHAGWIRLRMAGASDPVVNSIYSRVNADSLLFDPSRGLFMRDAENGKKLFAKDPLLTNANNEGPDLLDAEGNPLPLESAYAIPNAIEAIHARRLFVGGLNRILDNKILLPILCRQAPKFFAQKLVAMGIDAPRALPLLPPDDLPSKASSVDIVKQNPEDWVVKSPSLSGGKGVYILKTLSERERRRVLSMISAEPGAYAYQKLIQIARIPIAVREGTDDYRYANIAADVRMWVFFGDGKNHKPRLTHNGLVRTAPHEKGPMSSIVNTSQGGGYAPMLVVDDLGLAESIPAWENLVLKPKTSRYEDMPAFASAQIVQISYLLNKFEELLVVHDRALTSSLRILAHSIKDQCREVLSFLCPDSVSEINEIISILDKRFDPTRAKRNGLVARRLRIRLTTALALVPAQVCGPLREQLNKFRFWKHGLWLDRNSLESDARTLESLRSTFRHEHSLDESFHILKRLLHCGHRTPTLSDATEKELLAHLRRFRELQRGHFQAWKGCEKFSTLFDETSLSPAPTPNIVFSEPVGSLKDGRKTVATEQEVLTGNRIIESDIVSDEMKKARREWLTILKESQQVPSAELGDWISAARQRHFSDHPFLAHYQALIDRPAEETRDVENTLLQLLEILPYAKYNVHQFLKMTGRSLFSHALEEGKVALLNSSQRKEFQLKENGADGECFVLKRSRHGLFSDSNLFLWLRAEAHPFVLAYTLGHELVHYHQIRNQMLKERIARESGALETAKFLNFYGHYLSLSANATEKLEAQVEDRTTIYGFSGLASEAGAGENWVNDLLSCLPDGTLEWNRKTRNYGSLLGYSIDSTVQAKAKALREVIPALENARNIRFAKELGLRVNWDEFKSALPMASGAQLDRVQPAVEVLLNQANLEHKALRFIANYQLPGIWFSDCAGNQDPLELSIGLDALNISGGYNQTQQ